MGLTGEENLKKAHSARDARQMVLHVWQTRAVTQGASVVRWKSAFSLMQRRKMLSRISGGT